MIMVIQLVHFYGVLRVVKICPGVMFFLFISYLFVIWTFSRRFMFYPLPYPAQDYSKNPAPLRLLPPVCNYVLSHSLIVTSFGRRTLWKPKSVTSQDDSWNLGLHWTSGLPWFTCYLIKALWFDLGIKIN